MSIFVSEIAFIHNMNLINIAKMSILLSACISIVSSIVVISFCDATLKIKILDSSSITNKHYIS
jgi:NhaA family Na+:H+ antiporter